MPPVRILTVRLHVIVMLATPVMVPHVSMLTNAQMKPIIVITMLLAAIMMDRSLAVAILVTQAMASHAPIMTSVVMTPTFAIPMLFV